jgi:hypothetical protein
MRSRSSTAPLANAASLAQVMSRRMGGMLQLVQTL